MRCFVLSTTVADKQATWRLLIGLPTPSTSQATRRILLHGAPCCFAGSQLHFFVTKIIHVSPTAMSVRSHHQQTRQTQHKWHDGQLKWKFAEGKCYPTCFVEPFPVWQPLCIPSRTWIRTRDCRGSQLISQASNWYSKWSCLFPEYPFFTFEKYPDTYLLIRLKFVIHIFVQ